MGKKPGEIIESQGQLTQQFLNSFSKAFNDEPEFKQVMDAVKYAQVSPGRDLARILNKPTTKSPDYISSKTKNVSGFVDFMYQIAIDPLTWVLGGATKIPGLATKVNMGDQMVRNIQQFGTLGVKKSFEESAPLRNHWDREIGPLVKRLAESNNAADEAAIMKKLALSMLVTKIQSGYNYLSVIKSIMPKEPFSILAMMLTQQLTYLLVA